MIEKNFVIFLHSAQVIARGVIAYASPTGLSLGDKVQPRIGRWFLFHEPEIFHKFQIPSSQHPKKPQAQIFDLLSTMIGDWQWELRWSLDIGTWSLKKAAAT